MNGIDQIKQKTGGALRRLCHGNGLAYSSLMRWRRRRAQGASPVKPRGPERVPVRAQELWDRLRGLRHGRHRSMGAPALYPAFRDQLTRRHVRRMVQVMRQEVYRQERAEQRRIDWQEPGVIWSIDELEIRGLGDGDVFWLQVQDLGSRYKFGPVVEQARTSAEIATLLRRLFATYGAPLFLKRDHAGNLNGPEVNAVLDEFLVVPLNSPPYYPPYNGAIEEAQKEFQEALMARLAETPAVASQVLLVTEVIGNELNHRPRPCLAGQCACVRFQAGRLAVARYNRPQRKEVYREILAHAEALQASLGASDDRTVQALWRRAVETWMQSHDFIRIHEPKECYPLFSN